MTVETALAVHPKARWVFAAYKLFGCTSCAQSSGETIEEVGVAYGIDVERLLADLNAAVA